MKTLILIVSLLIAPPTFAFTQSQVAKNKETVKAFYEMAFNAHQPTEAAKKYFGSQYIQHNPHVPNGAEPFYSYFEKFFKENPESHADIKRVVGDGDLVILHVHSTQNKADRGRAVMDIFRLQNGKIVEHWDVAQEIPEKAANSNTMF
jgi:predicted SnoaL-like aldol condensation-catalyzing enzyme